MEFTNDEKVDMLFIYAKCLRNPNNAIQMYRNTYPDRRIPSARYFGRLERTLRKNGSFIRPRHRNPTVALEGGENEMNVLGILF